MRFLIFLIILYSSVDTNAQSFHYINYNIKNGLAGSMVYNMCQDEDGFMWFATNNGLSRYDGTHFKNYSIKDGLPDNEVLKVFGDKKGRVWIVTFSKELCYYYKGKIYNRNNNNLLKKIQFENNPMCLFASKSDFICIASVSTVFIITPQDSVLKHTVQSFSESNADVDGWAYNFFGKIRLSVKSADHHIGYEYDEINNAWVKKNIDYHYALPENSIKGVLYVDSENKKGISIKIPGTFYTDERNNNLSFLNTSSGSWQVDTVNLKLGTHYLKDIPVSYTLVDNEKNTWFSSLGKGVFKLPSANIKMLLTNDSSHKRTDIYSLIKYKNFLVAGANQNRFYFIDSGLNTREHDLSASMRLIKKFAGENRLYSSVNISDNLAILGFDGCIVKLENNKYSYRYLDGPVKTVEKVNDSFLIAGTAFYAFKIRIKDLEITDTLWRERCTKVFFFNSKYYIGTLAGLFEVKNDKSSFYLGSLHQVLGRRIIDIKADQYGVLWMATSDKGIIGIKDRKIVRIINDSLGLASNTCKTLFVKGKYLWAGTNKGICKINIEPGNNDNITKYGLSDGLSSNNINCLYLTGDTIWMATPEGVSFFEEKNITSASLCHLVLTDVKTADTSAILSHSYKLGYKNNHISFQFSGISYRSGGEITYYYKLTGLDKDWRNTTDNYLDYKTLPSGSYQLNIYAENKYGIKSNIILIDIIVATPFWKATWFYIVLTLIAIGIIALLFNRRNKLNREKSERTNMLQKQFAELEQQALQSQMNPHFIFNCLNSIQQYIFTGETEKANQYLTQFAHLIRQTLVISSQKNISLSEEMNYLKSYLNMEQMRFGDNFIYYIQTIGTDNPNSIKIPSMLIQPFVENSLRHGIRYLAEKKGKIEVLFYINKNSLMCQVKDNGVGRQKAAEYQSFQHIEYQSRGMNLTAKRIELLNSISDDKISLTVTDLTENNNPSGTLVEINIPLQV